MAPLPCLALPCLALPKEYERPCNRQANRFYSTNKQRLDSKSLVFDFWFLAFDFRILISGFWFLVFGFWFLVFGFQITHLTNAFCQILKHFQPS